VYSNYVKRGANGGYQESSNYKWDKFKYFAGCCGKIDGSHIPIRSDALTNRAFFSSRKKIISTNVPFVSTVVVVVVVVVVTII